MSSESSLLRPCDSSQLNSDDWPEFELNQAFVFDPQGSSDEPVSLLHAGHYRPLSITGRLEPPNSRNLGSWLDSSTRRAVRIELTDIKEFSYGEYGDGTLDIWAAGQSGWFTIRPSIAYREMYSDMIQALKLLYFMADSYKALRKYADLPAPYFFKKCSDEGLENCNNVTDVADMFTKHRYFLIASMLANKESLQWYRVPLYTWFKDTFPDDFLLVRERIKPSRSTRPSSQKSATQSPAPSTVSSKRKQGAADQRGATPKSVVSMRSTRSTRSTRSQSNATVNSLPMIIDTLPDTHSQHEVVSTPAQPMTYVDLASSSSEDEVSYTGGKGKGKSALRPRPSKYISSQTNKIHKKSPTSSRTKKAAAAVQAVQADTMVIDSPEDETEQSSEKANEDATEDSDEDNTSRTQTAEAHLPFHLKDSDNNGDVWHCPVDGCMHKTYAASEPSSQLLIKAHSQTHDFDHDERVQLVRRMEAPYLPVNRLMDRVRGMAAGSRLPARITQRY